MFALALLLLVSLGLYNLISSHGSHVFHRPSARVRQPADRHSPTKAALRQAAEKATDRNAAPPAAAAALPKTVSVTTPSDRTAGKSTLIVPGGEQQRAQHYQIALTAYSSQHAPCLLVEALPGLRDDLYAAELCESTPSGRPVPAAELCAGDPCTRMILCCAEWSSQFVTDSFTEHWTSLLRVCTPGMSPCDVGASLFPAVVVGSISCSAHSFI